MHIYFSGIGGTGLGPLALIAKQAGFTVSGSDKQTSLYIDYLRSHGVGDITIGQSSEDIAAAHARQPIDWYVYSSAVAIEQPNSPEMAFCREHDIHMSQRDELLNEILSQKNLKLIAIAGTHGKTTTTAMATWLCMQLGVPVSYSVGAKLPFGDMGHFDPASEYFVYEADEFARNFLSFSPALSLITGVDWDHPDIYPTRESYEDAFREFLSQSTQSIVWQSDAETLQLTGNENTVLTVVADDDPRLTQSTLPGLVNRRNALEVAVALQTITGRPVEELIMILNDFPGISRRFERVSANLYSDYAHTPPKVRGALETAEEVAGKPVVVVYEGLHNTRQHFIKDELAHLFDGVAQLYIVPSYLAREDPNLATLSPSDLRELLSSEARAKTTPSELDEALKARITSHLEQGDLVLCLSAGGGGSLDEWLRVNFQAN